MGQRHGGSVTFGWHIDTADTLFAITVCILAALVVIGIVIAVMQYINHKQRMTVFAEASAATQQQAESAPEKDDKNEEGDR